MTAWEWRASPVWWTRTRSALVLVAIGVGVGLSRPHPAVSGPGRWTAIALLLVAVGWLAWLLGPALWLYPGLLLSGTAGMFLAVTNVNGPAIAFPAITCLVAGTRVPPRRALAFATLICFAYAAGILLTHGSELRLFIGLGSLAVGLATGLFRQQNAQLYADAQRAREEESVLAERARIAREIHDVLAHALAALSLQLELADALLERGRTDEARVPVRRAGSLAREGLAETRRAIGALRGEALPLPALLDALVSGYRDDLSAPARLTVDGPPRDLDPDTGLTLYRTAQEALTNVRKHAPGAPVSVALTYEPSAVALTVHSGQSDRPPTDHLSSGYGLTGLRERAELVGGQLRAGPDGDGWLVGVRIPT